MFGFLKRGSGLFLENHADSEWPVGDIVRGSVHAMPESGHVSAALSLCLAGNRNIMVTDRSGERFVGMVTSRNLLDFLGGGSLHQLYVTGKCSLDVPVSRIMQTGFMEVSRGESVGKALGIIRESRTEALPLVEKGKLSGMVTESDFVNQISRRSGVSVWEVMTRKPFAVRTSHPVSEVAEMLVKGGYRRLPVVRDTFLTGIVTPVDIIRYLNGNRNLMGLRRERCEIEKAMNKSVAMVGPHSDIADAVAMMREKRVCMLPVVDEYQLLGVISQRDILEAM